MHPLSRFYSVLIVAYSRGMAHIAIDARIINSSTGTYVERLLTYLQELDTPHTYTVIVPTKDKFYWTPLNSRFRIKTVDFANYSLGEQIGFKRFLDDLAPDLVHFCMPQQPVRYTGRTVTTFHDLTLLKTWNSDKNWLVYHIKQTIGRWVFAQVAKKSDLIIVPSQYTSDELIKFSGISPEKIRLTYEAADANPTELTPYPVPHEQFILYVGQYSDYKNIRRLSDAHQKLLDKYPNLGLVLVGRKKKDALALERYITDRGYRNIHFTGFIPNAQRDWLYQRCQAYIFPSLMEGFGLPGLEAMGYGAPVISSNATCLPEIYGDAALYFDPTDIDDMSHAIDRVLLDGHLRSRLIERGKLQHAKYSWQRMAEQTHDAYNEALS